MSETQTELIYQRIEADDARIGMLQSLLAGADWQNAGSVIAKHFARTGVRWHDRLVRDLANSSKGEIAGGQRGYKLVRQMSREEKDHCRNWMKSQARKMDARADEIELVWRDAHPDQ